MNNQLPNATAVLVLGILSILTCLCYGVPGLVMAGVALYLASKDMKEYRMAPEIYGNYSTLNIGRILSIIGLALNVLMLIATIYVVVFVGEEQLLDFQRNLEIKAAQQESDY